MVKRVPWNRRPQPPGWVVLIPLAFALGFALATLAIVATFNAAFGHGAADWIRANPAYVDRNGVHCCGPTDCRVAAPGEIERVIGGWVHVPTGTALSDGERGVYYSKDAQVWRCVRAGVLKCVFPGMGA